jgi:hypothetical protein
VAGRNFSIVFIVMDHQHFPNSINLSISFDGILYAADAFKRIQNKMNFLLSVLKKKNIEKGDFV